METNTLSGQKRSSCQTVGQQSPCSQVSSLLLACVLTFRTSAFRITHRVLLRVSWDFSNFCLQTLPDSLFKAVSKVSGPHVQVATAKSLPRCCQHSCWLPLSLPSPKMWEKELKDGVFTLLVVSKGLAHYGRNMWMSRSHCGAEQAEKRKHQRILSHRFSPPFLLQFLPDSSPWDDATHTQVGSFCFLSSCLETPPEKH